MAKLTECPSIFVQQNSTSSCLVDALNSLHVTRSNVVSRLPLLAGPTLLLHFSFFSFLVLCSHHAILWSRSSKPFCFRDSKTSVAFIFNVCGHSNITICVGGAQTQCIWGCTLLWYWACSLGWYSYSANKWMTMIRLIALLFFLSLLSLSIVKSPTWHQFSVRKLAKSLLSVSKIREFLCFFFII